MKGWSNISWACVTFGYVQSACMMIIDSRYRPAKMFEKQAEIYGELMDLCAEHGYQLPPTLDHALKEREKNERKCGSGKEDDGS